MSIENPLFLIPALTSLIFMLAGLIWTKYPPKKINGFYGYRTFSSMKNQERWDFAQKYASKEIIRMGFLLGLSSLIGQVYHPNEKTGAIIGLGLTIAVVVVLMVRVELAIKNKFRSIN